MGILLHDQADTQEPDSWWAHRWMEIDHICFYCGKEVPVEPTVVWSGHLHANGAGDNLILLHGRCAETLGMHLIGDSREVKLASQRGPLEKGWTRHVGRIFGQRIRRQDSDRDSPEQ